MNPGAVKATVTCEKSRRVMGNAREKNPPHVPHTLAEYAINPETEAHRCTKTIGHPEGRQFYRIGGENFVMFASSSLEQCVYYECIGQYNMNN